MTAEQLINYMIPPLKIEDDVARAKQWMDEFRLNELPVVEDGKFLGFISEDLIYDMNLNHGEVGAYPLKGQNCIASPWNHYFDVLKVIKNHEMGMVSVIDNGVFEGVVVLDDILNEFAQTAIVNTEGAILKVQCSLSHYSLSEISRIVEMNGSTIMGTNIRPNSDTPSLIDIAIRINHFDINQIISGLSEAGYTVIDSFNTQDESYDEEQRFGLLMKYIET